MSKPVLKMSQEGLIFQSELFIFPLYFERKLLPDRQYSSKSIRRDLWDQHSFFFLGMCVLEQ